MPTVFIGTVAVPLPYRVGEQTGDPLTELHARILDTVLHRRVKAKLRWLLERGEILPQEIHTKASELCAQDLKPYATLDDGDDEDPILVEAMAIARDLIITRMAQENLPPPKNIDVHAKQIVDNVPAIQEQARRRVEARYRAAAALIGK